MDFGERETHNTTQLVAFALIWVSSKHTLGFRFCGI